MTTTECLDARSQLELTFANPEPAPKPKRPVPPRSRRHAAARWWFARMRDVVREARSWNPEAEGTAFAAQEALPLAFPPTRWTGYRQPGADRAAQRVVPFPTPPAAAA